MSIQHFLFEWDSEKYEHFLSNIPVIQIPEIGETCIKVERFSHASLCTSFFSFLVHDFVFLFLLTPPPPPSPPPLPNPKINGWLVPQQTCEQQETPLGMNHDHEMWFTHECFLQQSLYHYQTLDRKSLSPLGFSSFSLGFSLLRSRSGWSHAMFSALSRGHLS